MTTRLIIDCDTGTDDAVAILAAALHPDLELLGVTTVNGNVPLANTTENSLRVLDHVGSRVPVYSGADRPITRPDFPIPRDVLNAEDPEFQVDYLDLAPSTSTAQTGAVRYLIDTFLDEANSDVVLVAVGPLTNVALALIAEPSLAAKISQLVIMGGAHVGGNVTATAEFNFWVDPEAARAVLSAGIRDVVIFPLDATHSAPVTVGDCDALDASGTPAATAAAKFIRHRIEQDNGTDMPVDTAAAPVHDSMCIAYLTNPEVVVKSGRYPVTVETAGEATLGQMIVDTRAWSKDEPTATVAFAASPEIYNRFLLEALSRG